MISSSPSLFLFFFPPELPCHFIRYQSNPSNNYVLKQFIVGSYLKSFVLDELFNSINNI